jgi:hypothetical protein
MSASDHVRNLGPVRESIHMKPVRERVDDWREDMSRRRLTSTGQTSQKCINVRGKASGED